MADRIDAVRGLKVPLCAAVLAAIIGLQPAFAASYDQIVDTCKQQLHDQIMACAIAKGLKGDPQAVHDKCGYPLVSQCVVREQARQAAGTPAPAAPKEDTAVVPGGATPVQPTFVAPPRTIADITAILDSEKPDGAKIAARKAAADATPPNGASATKLAEFYHQRSAARALLARNKDALADGQQALDAAKGGVDPLLIHRIQQLIALQYRALGDPKDAIATLDLIVRGSDQPGGRGALINALGNIVRTLVSMGDVSQAGTYQGRLQQRIEEARGSVVPKWRAAYAINGNSWESQADAVRGMVFEARGQYPEAEAAFRRSEAFERATLKDLPKMEFPPTAEQIMQSADGELLSIARNESRQGKLAEAEADARRALLEILKAQGKYSPATPEFIIGLAGILVEQGRYDDAEKLARSALDVQRTTRRRRRRATNRQYPFPARQYPDRRTQGQGRGGRLCATRQGHRTMDTATA